MVFWYINNCRLSNAKSFLYIYIKYMVFDLDGFFWYINNCRLSNAKSFLFMYIKYMVFDLDGFFGISIIVAYLMPNPFYTYILNIWYLI